MRFGRLAFSVPGAPAGISGVAGISGAPGISGVAGISGTAGIAGTPSGNCGAAWMAVYSTKKGNGNGSLRAAGAKRKEFVLHLPTTATRATKASLKNILVRCWRSGRESDVNV